MTRRGRMPSEGEPTAFARLTREELADLVGDSVERIRTCQPAVSSRPTMPTCIRRATLIGSG